LPSVLVCEFIQHHGQSGLERINLRKITSGLSYPETWNLDPMSRHLALCDLRISVKIIGAEGTDLMPTESRLWTEYKLLNIRNNPSYGYGHLSRSDKTKTKEFISDYDFQLKNMAVLLRNLARGAAIWRGDTG